MQDRYAGDIGDYVKLALLRALSPGHSLGVAWYLYPDENHNSDGRHTSYLNQREKWRHLDPELFDALAAVVRDRRSVASLEETGVLGPTKFAREPITTGRAPASQRPELRRQWFNQTLSTLEGCDLVFADPDNGIIDDAVHRRKDLKFGKQMPLTEAMQLASARQAVIYHHNTRYPGGHDLEVRDWCERLGGSAIAVRANAYSCRTFFIINPSFAMRSRAEDFCKRWASHRVWLTAGD